MSDGRNDDVEYFESKSVEDKYFDAAAGWDEDRREAERLNLKRYKALAICAVVFAGLMGASVFTLLPLTKFVPVVIRVDNGTGAYDAKVAGETLDIGEKRNEKIIISDVTRYMKAREGFTRGEAEENYKTAYLLSCGSQRTEWDNYMNPQLNKNSPVTVLTNQDADRVTVQSVTFLQSLDEESKVAQVQIEKTVMRGSTQPLRYRYVSTLRVRYEPKNIPSNQLNFYVNPFGFCVDDNRRDPVGNPTVVSAPGGPNQELNQTMEALRQETDAALAAIRAQQELQRSQASAPQGASSSAPPAGTGAASAPAAHEASPTLSNIGIGAAPAAAPVVQISPSNPSPVRKKL